MMPPIDERPPPWLVALAIPIGLFAALGYWVLLRGLGVSVDGESVHLAAIGVCAAIATVTVPRIRRLSPEAREATRRDPTIAKTGSFGDYLDRTYQDMPNFLIVGCVVIFGTLDLVFISFTLLDCIVGDPGGSPSVLLGFILFSLFLSMMFAMSTYTLQRRLRAHRVISATAEPPQQP